MPNAHGRFVWHDLTTSDPHGAQSFYTQVVTWGTRRREESEYLMWTRDDEPIGGVSAASSSTENRPAHSPAWLPYVYIYDLDATVREARKLDGALTMGPREVADVGCWAEIRDPQGARIGLYEPAAAPGKQEEPRIGEFSWHELTTSDPKAALEFYRALFKWETISEFDMGEMGIYHIFGQRGATYGGVFTPPGNRSPSWLSYIRVEDVKPAAEKVRQLGGTILNGPMEVPGGDWIVRIADPQGAMVALHAR